MSEKPKKKKKYPSLKKCRICGLRRVDGVIIHKTPRNEVFREKWIKATKTALNSSTVVCSNHFRISDYKDCDVRKILKPGSIPSLNLDGKTENVTFSKTFQRLSSCETSNLSDKHNVDSDSEDLSSSQTYENTKSEEEICYIYYLDEKQNVRYYQTSTSDNVEGIYSKSSDSNQVGNSSNFEASHGRLQWNMEYDQTQSISNCYTVDQS